MEVYAPFCTKEMEGRGLGFQGESGQFLLEKEQTCEQTLLPGHPETVGGRGSPANRLCLISPRLPHSVCTVTLR